MQSMPKRELLSEFTKAAAIGDAPSKRMRHDGGIIYESGKEVGESMYQLITRSDQKHHADFEHLSENIEIQQLNDASLIKDNHEGDQ